MPTSIRPLILSHRTILQATDFQLVIACYSVIGVKPRIVRKLDHHR